MIFPDKWSNLPTGGVMIKALPVALYELTSMITTYSVSTVFPNIVSCYDLSICAAGLDCDFTVNGIVMDKPNAHHGDIIPLQTSHIKIVNVIGVRGNVAGRKFNKTFSGLNSDFVARNPDKVSKKKSDDFPIRGYLGNATPRFCEES